MQVVITSSTVSPAGQGACQCSESGYDGTATSKSIGDPAGVGVRFATSAHSAIELKQLR
jgi:hypothetical protein